MDTLELDAGQVDTLAGEGYSFAAGTDITVVGTSFLSGDSADLTTLLGSGYGVDGVNVTLEVAQSFVDGLSNAALAQFEAKAFAAGVDTIVPVSSLADSAEQSVNLMSAMSMASSERMQSVSPVVDLQSIMDASPTDLAQFKALFGSDADAKAMLALADLQNTHPADAAGLSTTIDHLQSALHDAGIHQIEISDDLANALADADVQFLAQVGTDKADQTVVLQTQADGADGTAYLSASLEDLRDLGVDEVRFGDGVTKVEVALHDLGEPAFTLSDLPQFQVQDGTAVALVITEDDLAALLAETDDPFAKLAASGITELQYTGTASDAELAAFNALNSTLELHVASLNPVEVELLGLGTDPTDPTDPFGFHPPKH
jgi:hypothetical protein